MNAWKQERNRRIINRFEQLRTSNQLKIREAEDILAREFPEIGKDMIHKILFDKAYQTRFSDRSKLV